MINSFGNYTKEDREIHDYYATAPSAVYPLFTVESFTDTVMEPACGGGHMADAIKASGYEVVASDLIDRGYGDVKNFYEIESSNGCDIITNPPYKEQRPFAEHALEILPEGGKLAMFLKIQFLESMDRYEFFKKYPPKRIWVFSKRARTAKNGDFSNIGSALACFAWFVWEKGFTGKPEVGWILPMDAPVER